MNIFEYASRNKLRFQGPKGPLTVEQLWDLPLTASRETELDLDSVAISVSTALRTLQNEESFVRPVAPTGRVELEIRLEILRHIIAAKIADRDESKRTRENAQQKDLLLSILAEKENEGLRKMSPEDLRKKIAELG